MSDITKPDGRTKPDDEKATSHITLRVTQARKAAYVRKASGEKKSLAAWAFEHLDAAAGYEADK